MALQRHLTSIAKYNWQTLRSQPFAELSGALGDLGTLLPLMIAMAWVGSIDLSSTLVFSGLANILTGVVYGVPLPVQPMKAIAAVAISQRFSKGETAAAGLTMGIAVFALSATGLLRWLHHVVPVPVVKGIQVGAGLSLAISAGSSLILPLAWASPAWDNRIWAIAAFLCLIAASLYRRVPYALIVFTLGLVLSGIAISLPANYIDPNPSSSPNAATLWHPHPFAPSGLAWRRGAIDAAIPQLPLTTLNSILAVVSLCATLFPDGFPPTPSTTSMGFSVALANLIGCWFGAMPICHGSGGLAGQFRFGARSGASIIVLGAVKLVLGLFVGGAIVPLLEGFPKGLLGIMVLAAGVELAKVGRTVGGEEKASGGLWEDAQREEGGEEGRAASRARGVVDMEAADSWMVMLVTATGCLAFKNDAVGFLAGLAWHWGLRLPGLVERLRAGRSVRLERGDGSVERDTLLR